MIDSAAIREALTAIADEAPGPERIRANLTGRTRRHRQRRLVLRLAGTGVATAAVGLGGLGTVRLLDRPRTGFPEISDGPGGGWLEVPLRQHPTWLPPGHGQSQLRVLVSGKEAPVVARQWERPGTADARTPIVALTVGWHESLDADRPTGRTQDVDVAGVAGQLVRGPEIPDAAPDVHVIWQPPGEPQLILTVLGDDTVEQRANVALRVARSTRPDPRHIRLGPRPGWLPIGLAGRPWQLFVNYEGADWRQLVSVTGGDGRQLMVLSGPGAHAGLLNQQAARPVRVLGSDGWHVPDNGHLFFTLPDGVAVFVGLDAPIAAEPTGGDPETVPLAELVRIAEEFDFGPWPDMSWVGSR
ncbi:hypothetical protein [Polymorphospora sp. NPDC050346]|uniref:hypothetical protein n=1 Tax=Polymorphospora sp. NPDC050346 TaxID=3155780 RepID=UPI0033F52BD5